MRITTNPADFRSPHLYPQTTTFERMNNNKRRNGSSEEDEAESCDGSLVLSQIDSRESDV